MGPTSLPEEEESGHLKPRLWALREEKVFKARGKGKGGLSERPDSGRFRPPWPPRSDPAHSPPTSLTHSSAHRHRLVHDAGPRPDSRWTVCGRGGGRRRGGMHAMVMDGDVLPARCWSASRQSAEQVGRCVLHPPPSWSGVHLETAGGGSSRPKKRCDCGASAWGRGWAPWPGSGGTVKLLKICACLRQCRDPSAPAVRPRTGCSGPGGAGASSRLARRGWPPPPRRWPTCSPRRLTSRAGRRARRARPSRSRPSRG